jgi:hypothetical protein
MRYAVLLAAAAIVVIPATSAANDFADACRRFASARVVFIGTVTSLPVRRHVSGEEQIERFRKKWSGAEADMAKRNFWPVPFDFILTPMRVDTAYRNIETRNVYVRAELPDELHVGQSYLIYGHHAVDSVFPDILIASGVVPNPDLGGDEVRFLNLARTQKVSASIYGSLVLYDAPTQVPLADVPIRFTSDDEVFEAITNAAGRFIVTGIRAGIISVKPLLPPGLVFDAQGPYRVSLPDGGCSELHLRANANRGIRGTLLRPDGTPVAFAMVNLVPLAQAASRWNFQTNAKGEFDFRGLAPRTYVLGINLDRLPTSASPYAATYYPTPIDVSDQSEPVSIEWILESPIPTGDIEVFVDTGNSGADTVVACAVALAADGQRHGFTQHTPYTARGASPVILPVVEGVRYRVIARASIGNRNVDSEPLELIGAAGRQTITLRAGTAAPSDPNVCDAAF